MTPIADMVAEMLAKGIPHDTIVLAVKTAEMMSRPVDNPVDKTADKRRAWDRERRRKQRVNPPESTGHPPESANATISILEDSYNKKERSSRGKQLPPDWIPNDNHYREGERLGHCEADVRRFGEDMRLWAEANCHRPVAKKADWDKTFAGWIRRQKPTGLPPKPPYPPLDIGITIHRETPQADAWEKHRGKPIPWGKTGTWCVPSEYPPGHCTNGMAILSPV